MNYAPNKGTKGYDRVVKRGCGGRWDYWGEFDCKYDYPWDCDYCPNVIEKEGRKNEQHTSETEA